MPNPSPRCLAHPISLIPFVVCLMAIASKLPFSEVKSNNLIIMKAHVAIQVANKNGKTASLLKKLVGTASVWRAKA